MSGALAAAATCGVLIFAGAAQAAIPTVLDPDGKTAAVYSYASAIRERVWVEPIPAIDQDANGVPDRVALDIMCPAETAPVPGLDVPATIYPSPYLTSLRVRGTHTGEMMGIPATGKSFEYVTPNIGRFENGRAAEHWADQGMFQFLTQIGVVQQPAAVG